MNYIIQFCVGNYTREKTGVQYQYDGKYTVGNKVVWSAVVQYRAHVKGEPCGVILNNLETGEALQFTVRDLIESSIEDLAGVQE